ncbi:5'-deoxynucleotidase [Chengkuizengella axinellae]|uniref:5'-deoxynucleotidase n=1 Tax=Chengkuizengella axinellae TaxID=3064388 RepID=A0ABT9IYX4_9BACL|nr:5'-deoxynucleotidase [Chengkuizengella sp. 2205SS18-9]MDP5274423.1 5'-deoxynucleotidase [Chengkuizengella sp. 2205SS18-9]
MENHHFLAYMYRLRYIKRWSLMRNVVDENVAEHSYHVSLITHILCSIANEVFNKPIHTERAVSLALFHDATEVFTGDIPTPVKHHNNQILNSFREIEELASDHLMNTVPDVLKMQYETLIQNKDDDELIQYVKAADDLDAYIKCISELSAGNKEFATAKKDIELSLQNMNMPEIDYFLSYLAPSFEKTLDELSLFSRNKGKPK